MQRLPRIGEGAYELFGSDGEINAVFYFFNVGNGVEMHLLARPGLIVREENPLAPLTLAGGQFQC